MPPTLMEFVKEQNAEPQAILLSLVDKESMREANECTLFAHLRPKFVVRLLELVQEEYGPGAVDEERGHVTESARERITSDFSSCCTQDNRWMWFPCPKPIAMFIQDILGLKFVMKIDIDLDGEILEPKGKKRRVTPDSMIQSMAGLLYSHLEDRGLQSPKVGIRAWNLTCQKLDGQCKDKIFIAIGTSLICREGSTATILENLSRWIHKKDKALYNSYSMLEYKNKNTWLNFVDGEELRPDHDHKEFMEVLASPEIEVRRYTWEDHIEPTDFNARLQYIDT